MKTFTITCNCKFHNGKSAEVRDLGQKRPDATEVHNLVAIAHNPVMQRSYSAQKFGPWPVKES